MCLGRRDDRDFGGDRGFPGSRFKSTDDGPSDQSEVIREIAGRDAGEAGEKIRIVLGEVKKTAAIERSEDTDSSDRLESEPEANQALGVKVRMTL